MTLPSLLLLLHRIECFDLRLLTVQTALLNGCDHAQHAVVIVRQNFLELGQEFAEVVKDLLAAGGAGGFYMRTDEFFQGSNRIYGLYAQNQHGYTAAGAH